MVAEKQEQTGTTARNQSSETRSWCGLPGIMPDKPPQTGTLKVVAPAL
jgi:hypothetical protein